MSNGSASDNDSGDDEAAVQPPGSWEERFRANSWLFGEYRRREWPDSYMNTQELGDYRDEWEARTLPRLGRLKRERILRDRGQGRHPVFRRRNAPALLLSKEPGGLGYPGWEDAKKRYNDIEQYFSNKPGLNLVAPLGYGGNGLAAKCQYRANPFAPALNFVVKIALHGWESSPLYHEEVVTERFNRAAHFVQVVPRDRVGLPPQRPFPVPYIVRDDSSSSESESGDESPDDEPSRKFMRNQNRSREYLLNHYGERYERKWDRHEARDQRIEKRWQQRLDAIDAQDPDPQWQIDRKDFLLLELVENDSLHLLIARYPPRKFHPGRRVQDPPNPPGNRRPRIDLSGTGKRVGTDLFEQAPQARKRWAAKRWVHWDIDPQNSGLDPGARDGEHDLVPRLKLADFGLAEQVKLNKDNNYYVNRRGWGKWGHFAPEQFGVEWDYVRQEDGKIIEEGSWELAVQPIAGNYGAHTNVWGVALTMWQLITKCKPVRPPRFQRATGSGLPGHYAVDILSNDKYNRVDRELREIIARCMANAPRERPGPRSLVSRAIQGVKKVFPGETDDMIRQWVQDMIFNPPPDPDPEPPPPKADSCVVN
ncbi:kinase-like protein [Nemania abortiva]|nr:kinase-like protein [Nemania abortiva]